MNGIDLQRLRVLAMAATPGPWGKCESSAEITGPAGTPFKDQMIIYDEGGHGEADAEFIAAANPATVLALLDEIERLQHSAGASRVNNAELAHTAFRNFVDASLNESLPIADRIAAAEKVPDAAEQLLQDALEPLRKAISPSPKP